MALFDSTLRQMLSMFPKGATNDQIVWRLRSSGLRVDVTELLHGLTRLSQSGEIIRDARGRWTLAEFTKARRPSPGDANPDVKPGARKAGPQGEPQDIIYAVGALRQQLPAQALPEDAEGARDLLPEWSSLFNYYAATQRHDPRGKIEEFRERHGQNWHLVRTSGHWWSGARLRITAEALPEAFREGLARRNTNAAALGWPVSVFHGDMGASFVPGLIVPADWRFEGEDLIFEIEAGLPALNPAWMRFVRAKSGWSETALQDCLFPEGEDLDLAAVGERMKHALATLGAGALRPGELAGEIAVKGNGIRNAAGIFLPDDGSFTKGAAQDLETLRSWDLEKRSRTALSALIEGGGEPARDNPDLVPLLAPNALTPGQGDGAECALRGPVTVIQGPPGTGKSQVILSLLISAIASGRTVLFAAKNHQAVDEVEKRLRELVGDAPLLVRARDADGERDVSFIDALNDIAKGEVWNMNADADPRSQMRTLLDEAEKQSELRRGAQELDRLHIEACDLAERLELFRKYSAEDELAGMAPPRAGFFSWLAALFRPAPSYEGGIPKNATKRSVERRLAAVKAMIASKPVANDDPAGIKDFIEQLCKLLPKLARRITIPDDNERRFAAERLKEIAFEKVKSARRMRVDDAMLVLRHRPIWAISTLSAPARIPLAPCLFDYVIFDEASQCDVASALPLMARARSAIIVGDPMQLRFIPGLGNGAEHALMDAAGLPLKGRAAIAQSVNSLFDFTDQRPVAERVFLADQFRSAPAIVDYLNSDFYGGKLVNRKEDADFKPPADYKPGLAWEDVAGHATRRDGGNVNKPEAARIAEMVQRLANDKTFEGALGIISPFNAQVAEIQSAVNAAVSQEACDRLNLRIATVDKWQGAETDVVLFSLVLSAGSPTSAKTFLQRERRRLNVAVSRARAVCVIVGDLSFARTCGVRHIEFLAKRATTPWSPPKIGLFDSDWERRLDTAMRARGLKPMPQHPVGTRYLDFALEANGIRLDVEVDGRRWHTDASGNRKVADLLRDREMRARGWKVLRFWVHELANDMEGCLDRIERELKQD